MQYNITVKDLTNKHLITRNTSIKDRKRILDTRYYYLDTYKQVYDYIQDLKSNNETFKVYYDKHIMQSAYTISIDYYLDNNILVSIYVVHSYNTRKVIRNLPKDLI